jgi:hypothetical protein
MASKTITKTLLAMFHRYGPDEEVSVEDVQLLRQYIDPYLHKKNKRSGITTKILTTNNNMYRSVVLYYYNNSGESSTASIPKAVRYYLTGGLETQRHRFYDAIRHEVGYQIVAYKKSLGGPDCDSVICQLCGTTCDKGTSQTDHFPTTFKTLSDDFFKGDYTHALKKVGIYNMLKSEELSRDWKEYHNSHAGYRELCAPCHKSV